MHIGFSSLISVTAITNKVCIYGIYGELWSYRLCRPFISFLWFFVWQRIVIAKQPRFTL
jgi:hypothetical protein